MHGSGTVWKTGEKRLEAARSRESRVKVTNAFTGGPCNLWRGTRKLANRRNTSHFLVLHVVGGVQQQS